MRSMRLILIGAAFVLAAAPKTRAETPAADAAPTPRTMSVTVDATDIARGLVHTSVEIPAPPGPLDLYYVEWTPGNHTPSGPIQNVVEFYVRDSAGRALDWRRDPTDVFRFTIDVPKGSPTITVDLGYIANQPAVNSRSSDTYGRATFGCLNWNTVLIYPAGVDKDEQMVEPTLKSPAGWRIATALKPAASRIAGAKVTRFERVSLATLVDSPVIFGAALTSYALPAPGAAPHWLHAVARTEALAKLPDARVEKFGRMIGQAERIFGTFPRSQYHFLVLLDDDIPGFGLEHCESTLISGGEKEFARAESDDDDPMTVVPHEYIHAWNGKLRAPLGLLHENYNTPSLTQLLWVYEGLTAYYTDVLAARCGLLTPDEYRQRLAARLDAYELQTGRRWRSVEDTASSARFLRAPSPAWEDLRRRQDYYGESALFWLECDAIIRAGTNGRKSLDDFCRAFYDVKPGPSGRPVTYTRADLVAALTGVYDGQDWDDLIRRRIESPASTIIADLPGRLGWRLVHANAPTDDQAKGEEKSKDASLRDSIGLAADKEGRITSIVPDSPADRARLAYGMKIVAVGTLAYTPGALRDAVRASPQSGSVNLLVNTDGERLDTFTLRYDGGMRYPRLERDAASPDLLAEITRPR